MIFDSIVLLAYIHAVNIELLIENVNMAGMQGPVIEQELLSLHGHICHIGMLVHTVTSFPISLRTGAAKWQRAEWVRWSYVSDRGSCWARSPPTAP